MLQEWHPSPGHLARTWSLGFQPETLGRGQPGSQDPYPALFGLPLLSEPEKEPEAAEEEELVIRLPLALLFHLFITVSFLPTVVTPFPELLGW